MKTILPLLLVGLSLALSHAGAQAQVPAQEQVKLAIEPQSLRDALNEWAQQTGFQLVAEVSGELTAPSVRGTLTPQAALDRLLAGSPLTYEWLNDRVVAIREKSQFATVGTWQNAAGDAGRAKLSVAKLVAESANLSSSERDSQPRSPSSSSEVSQRSRRDGPLPATDVGGGASLEQIVVTGSRLKSGQVAGSLTIFDRQRINELGVTSVSEVLNYLPQQAFAVSEGNTFSAGQFARLRGLSVGTTLVLINGRRTVTSALFADGNSFDLNTIPLAAVERIEVLTDAASAVYGTDAVGGVINVILKKDIEQPVAEVSYGAADGGAEERRASLTIGGATRRLRASAVFDYFDKGSLLGEDRALFADQDYRRYGSLDRRSTFANPGTVVSSTTANLPGLSSRMAAIPQGSTGVGLTPGDFLATAGQQNLDSIGRFASVVPESVRRSAAAFAAWDLPRGMTAFGEFLYSNRESRVNNAPASQTVNVPATNQFNPFRVPVQVRYLFLDPRVTVYEDESYRAVGGLTGTTKGWDWELSILRIDGNGADEAFGNIDVARMNAAVAATDPAEALNVFADGPGGNPDLLARLFADPVLRTYEANATQGTAFVRGSVFTMPGGAAEAVFGAEKRTEEVDYRSGLVQADRDSSAAFMELRLPLLSRAMSIALAENLSVRLAGRYDDYDDFGSTFNPQYGLEWQPFSKLLLRTSYGTSFRAPSLFDLYAPQTTSPTQITDPRRNNETVSITFTSGGNADLKPEEAESWTAGFVLLPGESPGSQTPRLEVTYWRVHQDSRIRSLQGLVLLANESMFPERVVRAAPTPADTAAGRPGQLLHLDTSRINFGSLETSGVDLSLTSTLNSRFGQLSSTVSGTWVDKFRTIDLPNTPAVERVGITNSQGTIPDLRASATVAWSSGGIGLAATGRYAASRDDANTLNQPNGREIPSRVLIDVQTSLNLGKLLGSNSSWQNGLVIRAGVVNLLDEEPAFSENFFFGYDHYQEDLRQRFAYASVSMTF